jgi:peptide deformylase
MRVDGELRSIVRNMFDLMYESRGIGLAANQVDLPLRLFVANLAADPNEGEELVFINPVLSRPKGLEEQDEGCLSFPEMYGPVKRPKQIQVNAYGLDGKEIRSDLDGMLARVVQHEFDHLDGVLFIDRMSPTARLDVNPTLDEFETDFHSRRATGGIPDDDEIAKHRDEWEKRFC